MSDVQITTSSALSGSKSSRKKKVKGEAPLQASAPSTGPEAEAGQPTVDGSTSGADGSYESPYIKELYKYVGIYLFGLHKTTNIVALLETFATSGRNW